MGGPGRGNDVETSVLYTILSFSILHYYYYKGIGLDTNGNTIHNTSDSISSWRLCFGLRIRFEDQLTQMTSVNE